MSFCLRPNVCKKCGKPLTLFEGWTCLECEKTEQEPSVNEVLEQIRQEIDDLDRHYDNDYFSGNRDAMFKCNDVLQIIDKYKGDKA